jgi:hypothetical protein
MFSIRKPIGLFLWAVIFCFLFSSAIFAANEPRVVSPIGESNLINPASPNHHSVNPLKETGRLDLPCRWGNDILAAAGYLDGGFSADYDDNGYIYAARCTTYVDSSAAAIRIYKSTDGGVSWFVLTGFAATDGAFQFSYPVVLTGGNPSKLYVFAMTSTQNGDIGMARFTQNGVWEGWHNVKADADTITYFSVCTDDGSHLMLAYQKEENSHNVYTIASIDTGETWGKQTYLTADGAHPDIAYGSLGYVYLVWENSGTGDKEIRFAKNTNYCDSLPGSWQDFQFITNNPNDDTYPKIAALHTAPKDTACVWVVYNHYVPPTGKVTNIDLSFSYSTNSGTDWTEDQVLANDPSFQETAAEVKVFRSPLFIYVDLCYQKYPSSSKVPQPEICYTWSQSTTPGVFLSPPQIINDYWPHWSEDGREVAQIISTAGYPGIIYAGEMLKKDATSDMIYTGWNLWYDNHDWVDVNDHPTEENVQTQFHLSANYPNPFNPETKIDYFLPRASHVKLEVFNILGQRIKTIVDEDQTVGEKEVVWDGTNENGKPLSSGVYFYRLQTKDFVQARKMVLMK